MHTWKTHHWKILKVYPPDAAGFNWLRPRLLHPCPSRSFSAPESWNVVSLDWFSWENRNRKPMGLYHKYGGFRLKLSLKTNPVIYFFRGMLRYFGTCSAFIVGVVCEDSRWMAMKFTAVNWDRMRDVQTGIWVSLNGETHTHTHTKTHLWLVFIYPLFVCFLYWYTSLKVLHRRKHTTFRDSLASVFMAWPRRQRS